VKIDALDEYSESGISCRDAQKFNQMKNTDDAMKNSRKIILMRL